MRKRSMKKGITIGIGVLLVIAQQSVLAQSATPELGAKPTGLPMRTNVDMYLTSKATLLEGVSDADGSPYLSPDFKKSFIRTSTGERFTNIPVRLNLVSNEVQFNQNNLILALTNVDSLCYLDREYDSSSLRIFKTGYPAVDRQTSASLYELLAGGPVQVLKYYTCHQGTIKKMGEMEKLQFQTDATYYFLIDGKMVKFKPGKKNILDALPQYKDAINDILKTAELDLRKDTGIKDLFRELDARIAAKAF